MKHPLFLEPVFKERIWGGTALRDTFGYAIPSEKQVSAGLFLHMPMARRLFKTAYWQVRH